jgi:DNA topoisomerase VI subunit B
MAGNEVPWTSSSKQDIRDIKSLWHEVHHHMPEEMKDILHEANTISPPATTPIGAPYKAFLIPL